MNRFIFLILALIPAQAIFAQLYSNNIDFPALNKRMEISQENNADIQLLLIRKTEGDTIKKMFIYNEYDPSHFVESYSGNRNFVIIGGRYHFYIVDAIENNLIGPIEPMLSVEKEDMQTGMLQAFKIADGGNYLFINAVDVGLVCFGLSNIKKPIQLHHFYSDTASLGECFFIDKSTVDTLTMISAKYNISKNEINFKILNKQYSDELNSEDELYKQLLKPSREGR